MAEGCSEVPAGVRLSELSLSQRSALEAAFNAVQEQVALILRGGVVSLGLFFELATFLLDRTVNVFAICDALARLEGDLTRNAGVKAPTRYTRNDELRGLWHAHFFDAHFLARNLVNENTLARVTEIMRPHFGRHVEEIAGQLAGDLTVGALECRSARRALTGECIVLDGSRDQNYYLSVRWHRESDEAVAARIAKYRAADSVRPGFGWGR